MRLRRVVRAGLQGAVAGAVGTLAMDALWYARYRKGGGTSRFGAWETAAGTTSYDGAAAPALTGQRIMQLVLHRDPPASSARAMTNAVHWSTGVSWGAMYGVATAVVDGLNPVVGGLGLATVAWGSSYVVLPPLGVYKPIWKYDVPTLLKDASAHVVYGLTTATVMSVAGRS